MKTQIEQQLQQLIGLEFTNTTGAMNMEMLHFGVLRVNLKNDFITGLYRLHIHCPWRIIQDDQIFVAYFDLYEPNEAQKDLPWEEFDYNEGNLRDDKLRLLTKERARLVVKGLVADNLGGFTLFFDQNTRLEVIPMHSCDVEYWRMISRSSKEMNSHFVVDFGGSRNLFRYSS